MNGSGIEIMPDCSKNEGNFKDGKKEGMFKVTNSKGEHQLLDLTEKQEEEIKDDKGIQKLEIVDQPIDNPKLNELVEDELYKKLLQDFMPIYE